MDSATAAAPDSSLTGSFEKLFRSTVRLSGAATLYSVQQLEGAVTMLQGRDSISKQLDRFGTTFQSLAECLAEEISPGKQKALNSFADMTAQVVQQSWEGMGVLDPRQMFRLAGRLTRGAKKVAPAVEQPSLAAEVLGS